MFQAAIDRFRRPVGGAGAVEERQDVSGTAFQGAAELADLDQRGGNAAGDRVDQVFIICLPVVLSGSR